jgi:hypothetical protein
MNDFCPNIDRWSHYLFQFVHHGGTTFCVAVLIVVPGQAQHTLYSNVTQCMSTNVRVQDCNILWSPMLIPLHSFLKFISVKKYTTSASHSCFQAIRMKLFDCQVGCYHNSPAVLQIALS